MYAKIIRVKCSHSSKPLLGCEIFRKDARLLGAYENYKFSWIKKYGMYRNQNRSVSENSGELWRVIAEKEGKAYNARI